MYKVVLHWLHVKHTIPGIVRTVLAINRDFPCPFEPLAEVNSHP